MKKWFGLILLSGCAVMPSGSAEEACLSIFTGWNDAALRCGLEPIVADAASCGKAYSYDEDELSQCLGWMKSSPCEELHNGPFQAHCGKAIYLRTW